MKNLTYRIILTEEPEGGYTVNVPSLPGCITYGKNIAHAKQMAREAIEGYILMLKDLGEPLNDDSTTLEFSLTLSS